MPQLLTRESVPVGLRHPPEFTGLPCGQQLLIHPCLRQSLRHSKQNMIDTESTLTRGAQFLTAGPPLGIARDRAAKPRSVTVRDSDLFGIMPNT